jgi:glycosyltransferase 2 family protein
MFQWAGGIIVGTACLWLSLRGVRGAAVIDQIRHAALPFVALAILDVIAVAAGKALRWQWLFPRPHPSTPLRSAQDSAPAWRTVFGILMTGQMLNLLVPIRLGELARVGLMRQEGIPVGETLGTIVVEKSLDLLAVGLLLILAIPLAVLPEDLRNQAGIGGLALAVGLLLALVLVAHFRQQLLGLLQRVPAPARPFLARLHRNILRLAQTTLDSLAVLEGPHLIRVVGLTAVIWLLSIGGMLAMLAAFRLPFDFSLALVLMLAVTSSNWAPTPPALIGVIGAVALAVLAPFGVAHETAVALGAVLNAVLVAPPVLLGSWAVWARLVTLREAMTHAGWRDAMGLARHSEPARERP